MSTTKTTPAEYVTDLMTDSLGNRAPFVLARMADCMDPDARDSPGADFLYSVAEATAEAIEWAGEDFHPDTIDNDGAIHEIADGAPSLYTHPRWRQFVDLGAYQEDVEAFVGVSEDLTAAAGVALYMIAERLAQAIVAEYADMNAG